MWSGEVIWKIPISDRRGISSAVLSLTPLLPAVYESLEILLRQKFRQKLICSYTHNIILVSCPSGPANARGVGVLTELYVIYMKRYASHLAMLRSGSFSKFGILPITITTCQYLEGFLGEAPLSSYNIWQDAKNSRRPAKSTPLDPPWSYQTHT